MVYTWDFGDNSSSSATSPPAHHYAKDGTYTVRLSASSGPACADTSTIDIIVRPMPVGTLSAATSIICEGIPVPLIVKGGNVALYNWYYNNTALSSPHDSIFNALQGGIYKVDLVSQYGCKTAASSVQLSLIKKPVTDFSYNLYCIGLPTNFINQTITTGSGGVNYSWKFGNDDSSAVIDPVVTYNKPGLYKVRLTATPQQCPDIAVTKERDVLIEVPRKGVTYNPKNAVANTPVLLEARTFGVDYLWSPAINLTSTNTPATIYQGSTEQLYTIKITAASGCVTVDSQRVYQFITADIQVPKGFTPNGDGQNDKIYPFLVGVSQLKYFRIINRWGVVVYQSVTELPGWDGTYKGQAQPMDGYVWEAEAIDVNGKTIKRSGNITLIR